MSHAIAIDLGGTHASIAIVSEQGLSAVRHQNLRAAAGLTQLLPELQLIIEELLTSCGLLGRDCLGISLSLPSLVDFAAQRVVSCNDKFPDAMQVDLSRWAREIYGLPIALENDARAALIGEHTAGAARGASDVLMLTLGTGIGSALLVGGRPFRTRQAQGGNLGGHIPLAAYGRHCTCGAIGCMEAEASTWALPAIAHEWPGFAESRLAQSTAIDFQELFAASDLGDSVSQAILEHCIHVWSVGTVGLVHAYGPELVIFGGGVMRRAEEILPSLRTYVHRHAWTPSGPLRIVNAALGNDAALYAALPLLQNVLQGETLHAPAVG